MKLVLDHALYGNAPGSDGVGYRFISLPDWPETELQPLKSWLQNLEPQGSEIGFASHCIRRENSYYWLLAKHLPDFSRDLHGRAGGRLLHVMMMPYHEAVSKLPVFSTAMMNYAQSLQADQAIADDQRLDKYRQQLPQQLEVSDSVINVNAIQHYGIHCLFMILANVWQPSACKVAAPDNTEWARCVVQISTLLPPRLRLGFQWGAGLFHASTNSRFQCSETVDCDPSRFPAAAKLSQKIWQLCENPSYHIILNQLSNNWQIRHFDAYNNYVLQLNSTADGAEKV